MTRAKNRLGERHGRLVVIEQLDSIETHNGKDSRWLCQCDCGNQVAVRGRSLSKTTKSCGCYKRDKIRESKLLPEGQSSFNQMVSKYKLRADKKDLPFTLTLDDVKAITKMPCAYCGAAPSNGKNRKGNHNGEYIYNGIDRYDNTKGYTLDNSVPCCATCNRAKNDLSIQDWHEWLHTISLRWINAYLQAKFPQ